ncbi:hypothetical protein FRC19_001782 [Serendipita sp. 401]|nr:hypothetical protein FRC16_003344 [Serendipita sp. 398]KAG8814391.1 hypothetical protein FRC19_001782 [Serendipita sp. 401]KAG8844927.1 hypothetical protein FRC20_003341 [Serendipita sp. 405]
MSSRTPVNGIGYDKSLLANAPKITKEDKQEGYNPDLLEQGRPSPRPGTVPPGRTTPSHSSHTPLPVSAHPGSKGDPKYAESDESPRKAALPLGTTDGSKPKSRRKLFIILGVIGVIVVIALGAGLGAGLSKKNGSNGGIIDPTGTNIPPAFSQTDSGVVEPTKSSTSTGNEATGKPTGTSSQVQVGVPQDGSGASTSDAVFTRPPSKEPY